MTEIAENLRCPIGREQPLMTDAVIVLPSGQTYSQRSLDEYMAKFNVVSVIGLECPLTRVKIAQVVPNLCVRALADRIAASSLLR